MKKLVLALLAFAGVFALAGCYDNGEDYTGVACSELVVERQSVESERPTELVSGSSVTIASSVFNGDFFGFWSNTSYDNNIRRLVYDSILQLQSDGSYALAPFVESLESTTDNDGNVTYRLILDTDNQATFPESNEIITASVIKEIYDFYLDDAAIEEQSGSSSLSSSLESVTVIDNATVDFAIKTNIYTTRVTVFTVSLLDIKAYQTKADTASNADVAKYISENRTEAYGSGAYKLVSDSGASINTYFKLTANTGFTGKTDVVSSDTPTIVTPVIEELIVQVVSDEVGIQALISNTVDIYTGLVQDSEIDNGKNATDVVCNNYPRHGYGKLTFHTDFGVAADVNVRQAIAHAFDRATFIRAFLGSYGSPIDGPYSTNFWMIDDEFVEEELTAYTLSNEKVEALLSDKYAKGSDGIWAAKEAYTIDLDDGTTVTIAAGTKLELELAATAAWADVITLMFNNMADNYGIKVNVNTLEWNTLSSHLYGNDSVSAGDRKYHMFTGASSFNPTFTAYTSSFHTDHLNEFGLQTSYNTSRFINQTNDDIIMIMHEATTVAYEFIRDCNQACTYADLVSTLNSNVTGSDYEFGTLTDHVDFKNGEVAATLLDSTDLSAVTEQNVADLIYQESYLLWMSLQNEFLPELPLYSNDYHDLYNNSIYGFETSPLYTWPYAIVNAWVA